MAKPNKTPRCSSLVQVLLVATLLLWLLWGLLSSPNAPERALRTLCTSRLKQIRYACKLYAGDNADAFPADLGALVGDYVIDGELFICPSSGRRSGGDHPWRGPLEDEHLSYCYVSGLRATDDEDFILAFDEEWNHDREGIVVVYVSGRVDWVRDIEMFHVKHYEQRATLSAEGREMRVIRPTWSRWPNSPAYPVRPWHERSWVIVLCVVTALTIAAVALLIFRRRRRRAAISANPT